MYTLSTEDKLAWCEKFGDETERTFATDRLFNLGIASWPNLEKRTNKYAHDLFCIFQSDLKTVRTPLFKSQELYGIDPQYAVTFNLKDQERYNSLYPNIIVIFDIKWEVTEMELNNIIYKVNPMRVTVAGFLADIKNAIKADGNQKIEYKKRVNDDNGNAKSSYVFDARLLHRIG